MNYNPKEFGMRITKLRKELGKTQQETADLLHTSLDNYRGIEKGRRNPSLDLLVAMSAAFRRFPRPLGFGTAGRFFNRQKSCPKRTGGHHDPD